MIISKLPVGTKLMWDVSPATFKHNPDELIIYPAIVTEIHPSNPGRMKPQSGWVKVKSKSQSSWMGPEEQYLRLPTQEELDTLIWPNI